MAIMPKLDSTAIANIQTLQRQAASLLLYQDVWRNPASQAFLHLLNTLTQVEININHCLQAYGNWFGAIAQTGQTWPDFLIQQILQSENPFTQQAQHQDLATLPLALVNAAQSDLQGLQDIYNCDCQLLAQWVQQVAELPKMPTVWVVEAQAPHFLQQSNNWAKALPELAQYYRQHGVGLFARFRAFRYSTGQLIGIAVPDPIQLEELAGYDAQREALLKNTEFLLAGYPALHVLLYGSRGSGKSSLVKGLLHRYEHLRLIEVGKSELTHLPEIVERLRSLPQKFIIFVDDLSFEEDDDAFKSLKVVLEGNLTARPQNMVVYATSNRRHLIREFFSDRPRPSNAEEVNAWDTLQEKLSFSDRFGLTLTFESANQDTYLEIVRHLAELAALDLPWEDIRDRALQWATRHNGRSGRTARQFVDFLRAEIALSSLERG